MSKNDAEQEPWGMTDAGFTTTYIIAFVDTVVLVSLFVVFSLMYVRDPLALIGPALLGAGLVFWAMQARNGFWPGIADGLKVCGCGALALLVGGLMVRSFNAFVGI